MPGFTANLCSLLLPRTPRRFISRALTQAHAAALGVALGTWALTPCAVASSLASMLPDPSDTTAFIDHESPELIERLRSGNLEVANAAWWGFDPENATDALQNAILSKARVVVVPNMGVPWRVDPIRLASNQTVLFEAGVEVRATRGEAFSHLGSNLFRAIHAQNITLYGPGATLAMNYTDYVRGEHRHAIGLYGCTTVTIEGLRITGSGGDGVYVGRGIKNQEGPAFSEDITLRNLIIHQHRRQGVSIISCKGLLMENCRVFDIHGTAPQGGIDFEPNAADEFLVDCVVRNCSFTDMGGSMFLAVSPKFDGTSEPIDILFDNCFMSSPTRSSVVMGPLQGKARGQVVMRNCTVEGGAGSVILLLDKDAQGPKLILENTRLIVLDQGRPPRNPVIGVRSRASRPGSPSAGGGLVLKDVLIETPHDQPLVGFERFNEDLPIDNISGNILVRSPGEPRIDAGSASLDITFERLEGRPVTQRRYPEQVATVESQLRAAAGGAVTAADAAHNGAAAAVVAASPHVIWAFDHGTNTTDIGMRGKYGSTQLSLIAIGEDDVSPPTFNRLAGVDQRRVPDGHPLDNMLNGSTFSGKGGVARSATPGVDYFNGIKAFTIAGWLFTPEGQQTWGDAARIMSWYSRGTRQGFELMGRGDRLALALNDQMAVSEGGRAGYYLNGRWSFFAVTVDARQGSPVVRFYRGRPEGQGEFKVNLVSTVTLDKPLPQGLGPELQTWFALANEPGRQRAFAGRLDNIAFWSDRGDGAGALTPEAIEAYRRLSQGLTAD